MTTLHQQPIRHLSLAISFGHPGFDNATDEVGQSLQKLNNSNRHIKCVLPTSDSGAIAAHLADYLEGFRDQIQDEDQKITIIYGGHALTVGPAGQERWHWHAYSPQPRCLKHLVKLDPEPLLENFINSINNDVLLVFQCPFNQYRDFWEKFSAPQGRPRRNIQLIYFPDASSRIQSCQAMGFHGCAAQNFVVTPNIRNFPITAMAQQLSACYGAKVTVWSLLDQLTQASTESWPAPHHKAFLGEPEDFVINDLTKTTIANAQASMALRASNNNPADDADSTIAEWGSTKTSSRGGTSFSDAGSAIMGNATYTGTVGHKLMVHDPGYAESDSASMTSGGSRSDLSVLERKFVRDTSDDDYPAKGGRAGSVVSLGGDCDPGPSVRRGENTSMEEGEEPSIEDGLKQIRIVEGQRSVLFERDETTNRGLFGLGAGRAQATPEVVIEPGPPGFQESGSIGSADDDDDAKTVVSFGSNEHEGE